MDARRLLYWGDLDEARRRQARAGLARLSPWVYSAAGCVILALAVARGMGVLGAKGDASPRDAGNLWLAVVAASHAIVLLGAPFRLYWRRDASLIARSAISGRAIFMVGLIRSARAAALVALPCAVAALVLALGPQGSLAVALRHLILLAMAWLWAGLLGPAMALAAGAIVASDRAQAALASLGGELRAPATSWLGVLPGLAGSALVLLLLVLTSWARGVSVVSHPELVLALGVLAPLALLAWAAARAERVMVAALREVAALDQERLAHVERSQPSPLERLVARLVRGQGAHLIVEKDARLARRRYPIPFFLGVVGLIAQWILALAAPEDLLVWAGVVSAGLGAYGVIMARRSMAPPIEHLAYLRTLPVLPRAATLAKRARLILWVVVYMGLGAAPVIARAQAPATAAILLGAVAACTLAAGAALTRVDRA